jgi:rhomboid protease GluP
MLISKGRYPFTNLLLLYLVVCFFFTKAFNILPEHVGSSYQSVFVQHQYWRLLTATIVHTGYLHIILNLVNIYNFGSLLEDKLHSGFVTIVYLVGAVVSTAASILLNHSILTVGASGGIFSLVALFMLMLLSDCYKQDNNEKKLYNSITIMLSTSIFISIYTPGVNHAAHVIGFIIGILAFIFLDYSIKRDNKNGVQNK